MSIAYSPTENKGGASVQHLCHADAWFWSPATFPGCETTMDYADSHATVMQSVSDLHIIRFDQAWAKDGHVLLRYTAEGSHVGKPYKGIEATGKHAMWTAAAIFEVEDGKIRSFTKDWDQKTMQVSLSSNFHCRWRRDSD
jgi:ketosteroid isomerase-like protein